jgi:hypothetical protein
MGIASLRLGAAMNPIAFDAIGAFSKRTYSGKFSHLSRAKIAEQLRARVINPSLIDQGEAGLCPAAAVVYSLARSKVVEYVQAVIDLYEKGKAQTHKWSIEPCSDLLAYKPPSTAGIPEADWIIMASIRDSENWFFDFQSETDNGGAWGHEVERWLKKAGYTDVKSDWNFSFNKGVANLQKAHELYLADYQVCLLIDADMLKGETAIRSRPNHWVVLSSPVNAVFSSPATPVSMRVFTWGKKQMLPKEATPLDDFLDYYYGYVAAKF